MTALATLAGMIPLAPALRAGSQMLQALGHRGDWWNPGVDGVVVDRDAGGALLLAADHVTV
jgi:hypothetical protein